MKKVYGLIVEDKISMIAFLEKDNTTIDFDRLFFICTLDEVGEIINRCSSTKENKKAMKKWLDEKREEVKEFIHYINSSNYSDYYMDTNYSIDFLNALRRYLGYEMRFYKSKKTNDFHQVEFVLDANEISVDSIISRSIKRQRDKNSRLRGYLDSNDEKKYQLFYASISLKKDKNADIDMVREQVNLENEKKISIESLIKSLDPKDIHLVVTKDRDFDYQETKDQIIRLINSYGYNASDIESIDINKLYDEMMKNKSF